jgi:transcriptional regulator GlxA family with amidase domain
VQLRPKRIRAIFQHRQHGFWHPSQFAQDYREIFGETPSETQARARV